jgi:transmembrane sensor
MSPPNASTSRLQDEAVAWLVRVQSDTATADDWVDLTAWLEASDAHATAFAEAEALSVEVADNAGEIAASLPRPTAAVLPFKARRRMPVWGPMAGMAAAAAVVAVVAAPGLQRAYEGAPTTYRTSVGETRQVVLADGSNVRLDGASTMTVRMGWRSRRVDLGQAQASFTVAHDPRRPFLVIAGDQQVRDVGTEFNIRRDADTVVVSVRSGVVDVRQPGLATEAVARLTRGQELRHTVGTQVSQQQRVEPDAAFAWASGRLICHDEPLSQIVAELNRRYPMPIRVTAAAGARRFSGVLELGDQTRLVKTLADYLSLTVRRTDRDIALS